MLHPCYFEEHTKADVLLTVSDLSKVFQPGSSRGASAGVASRGSIAASKEEECDLPKLISISEHEEASGTGATGPGKSGGILARRFVSSYGRVEREGCENRWFLWEVSGPVSQCSWKMLCPITDSPSLLMNTHPENFIGVP